ncbi:MAG: EF-hand domain-containing protein, partial [Hyphomicrobium sp.]
GRLSKAQFAAADTLRKDGKLNKLEWLILVKSTFRAANPDGDRTIECDELHKGAGKALFRMLK